MNELQIEAEKNRLRKKVSTIYNALKKFNTTIERGDVKFNFTVILPPVPTIGFTEVAQMNDFGFVYDDDSGETVIEKVQPRIIIPRFYIVYDEKFIDNLEWAKKPDFNWLQAKIKEIVINKFKHFKINITHIQNHVWLPIDEVNLDDTSSLWNSNFQHKILFEETSETFEVEKQRLLKKLKSILQIYRKGTVTLRCESSDEDLFFDYEILGEPNDIKFLGKYGKPDELGNRTINGLKLETQFDEIVIYPKQQNDYLTLMKCNLSAYSIMKVLKSRFKKFDIIADFWEGRFIESENLNESWDIEKPLNHIFTDKVAPKYELLSSTITDQERNHLKKRAQKIYHTYNNGSFTAHLVSDETTSIDLKINYSLPDVPNGFNAILTKPEGSLNGRLTSYISLLISDIKLYIDFDNPYHQPLKNLIKDSLDKSGDYYTIPTKGKKRGLIVTDIILQALKKDILKNFKRFNINVHLRLIPKLEVAVNESWDDEGYKDRQYYIDLEENPISDEEYNRLKKKAKTLYKLFKEGEFISHLQSSDGKTMATGKIRYVLPDEPKSFTPEFKRMGGEWWDSEDTRRSTIPKLVVYDTQIKLYIVPTNDSDLNDRLKSIFSESLINNGDHYLLKPEQRGRGNNNEVVIELRRELMRTISSKFHKFKTQIGFDTGYQ